MNTWWICVCGILVYTLSSVQGTYRPQQLPCECHGKSQQCVVDSYGSRCLNCQGNTEGRKCERCKQGFYQQRAGESCLPCNCSSSGSVTPTCDSRGRCTCKPHVQGDKCDRCANGAPVTPIGCKQSCWPLSSSQLSIDVSECQTCFCHGHSSQCSQAKGYSVHTVSSTFNSGPEGWRPASSHNTPPPPNSYFRWFYTLHSLQAYSRDNSPIYLIAPASYLGNQTLSYGQTLSFHLRLDGGTRRPSSCDVILEGSGLRVTASLGDLQTVLPCGRFAVYSFRMDEKPDSQWFPKLTSLQFHRLLHNITAIKIRATYGADSRGFLDNVQLVSARQGPGSPASWVEQCQCPVGYEGQFCERCALGYRREDPARGPFSPCMPCHCHGNSCDSETGDCLSGDESAGVRTCPSGFYQDPRWPSSSCMKCPCPENIGCSVNAWNFEVKCDRCPLGVTGPRCNICDDGFFGDPLGENGPRRPCRQCKCSGQVDTNVVGNCDHLTGKCLKCVNHTTGFFCENCQDGFYHSLSSQGCTACNCNPLGSLSNTCSSTGQCMCERGFEGLKCESSACPACFDHVKHKMGQYSLKVLDMDASLRQMYSSSLPGSRDLLEKKTRDAEVKVAGMKKTADQLLESERDLLAYLTDITQAQSEEARDLEAVVQTIDDTNLKRQLYQMRVTDIQNLILDVRDSLNKAKMDLRQIELPLRDAEGDADNLSTLVEKSVGLAEKHQDGAGRVDKAAKRAFSEAEKAKKLMGSVMLAEDKVKGLVDSLKAKYHNSTAQVVAMENLASHLIHSAGQESRSAENALQELFMLNPQISDTLQNAMGGLVWKVDTLKDETEDELSRYEGLRADIHAAQTDMEDLLAQGAEAQQDFNELLTRANGAKTIADGSLTGTTKNLDELANIAGKLQGFSDQIKSYKAEADDSIKRLPAIAQTIQDAVRSNSQSLNILDSVEGDCNQATERLSELGDAMTSIEELSTALGSKYLKMKDIKAVKDDVMGLNSLAADGMEKLKTELKLTQNQEAQAKEAAEQGAGAYSFAKHVKDSVEKTLKDVNTLLSSGSFEGSSVLDENKFRELENMVANTRGMLDGQLKPRLQSLKDLEASKRATAARIDTDIFRIRDDIGNLLEIQNTIPNGCFNVGAIERP